MDKIKNENIELKIKLESEISKINIYKELYSNLINKK